MCGVGGGGGVGSRVHHTQKTTTNTVGQEVFQGLESRPFQLLYDPRNVGACSLNTEGLPEGNVVIHTGCVHFHTQEGECVVLSPSVLCQTFVSTVKHTARKLLCVSHNTYVSCHTICSHRCILCITISYKPPVRPLGWVSVSSQN